MEVPAGAFPLVGSPMRASSSGGEFSSIRSTRSERVPGRRMSTTKVVRASAGQAIHARPEEVEVTRVSDPRASQS